MRGRVALAAALVAVPSLLATHARAICGRPPAAYVSPEPGTPAPLNTHVRVRLPDGWRKNAFCPPDENGAERCAPGKFDLALVRAPGPGVSNGEVPATRRDSLAHEVATAELVPAQPLEPRTRYEVVHVDRGGANPPRTLGTFVTGDARDDTPPVWTGVTRASYSGITLPSGPRGVITLYAECTTPSVRFYGADPSDEATPFASLRFAIWMDDGHGPIDYASPPIVYERGQKSSRGFVVELGGSEVESTFTPPKGRPRARFGVRAVDWAGNVSPPSEVVVVFR